MNERRYTFTQSRVADLAGMTRPRLQQWAKSLPEDVALDGPIPPDKALAFLILASVNDKWDTPLSTVSVIASDLLEAVRKYPWQELARLKLIFSVPNSSFELVPREQEVPGERGHPLDLKPIIEGFVDSIFWGYYRAEPAAPLEKPTTSPQSNLQSIPTKAADA